MVIVQKGVTRIEGSDPWAGELVRIRGVVLERCEAIAVNVRLVFALVENIVVIAIRRGVIADLRRVINVVPVAIRNDS